VIPVCAIPYVQKVFQKIFRNFLDFLCGIVDNVYVVNDSSQFEGVRYERLCRAGFL